MNWRKLLDQISIDPKKFWEDGGWAAFDEGGGDDDDGDDLPPPALEGGERPGGVDGEPHPEDDYRPSGSEASDDYVDSEGVRTGSETYCWNLS